LDVEFSRPCKGTNKDGKQCRGRARPGGDLCFFHAPVPGSDTKRPGKAGRGLTARQLRFVEEYLIDLNATAAARRAGYSERTANEQGAQNLAKLSIQEAIQAALAERSRRTEINAGYVIQRLREEAELKDQGGSHSARVRALELLGKHLGMFPDRFEHRHGGDPGNSEPIRLAASVADRLLATGKGCELLAELAEASAGFVPPGVRPAAGAGLLRSDSDEALSPNDQLGTEDSHDHSFS
jgi:phage terminase small subunit